MHSAIPTVEVTLSLNGNRHKVTIEPSTTLLDVLRERLNMTGTKKGCDHGQCGACTVHLDGHAVLACLTLAIRMDDCELTTIEGLSDGTVLHPLQAAFVEHDGFQCGYCTPGQIMSASALLQENPQATASEIRKEMSGNLCRCAAYPNIVAAIRSVQKDRQVIYVSL